MTIPVAFIPDTPTLESAIARIERQFTLDGIVVERCELLGNGEFALHTPTDAYTYAWSHVTGTRRIG